MTDGDNYERPKIGAFRSDQSLTIRPAPNGGWVVYGVNRTGELNVMLGAYGSANELLSALSQALNA